MSAPTQHESVLLLARAIVELADDAPGEGVRHARYLVRAAEEGKIIDPTSVAAIAPTPRRKIPRRPVLTNALLQGIESIEGPREPVDLPGCLTNESVDRALAKQEHTRTLRERLARR
jgi:hypothetical protein